MVNNRLNGFTAVKAVTPVYNLFLDYLVTYKELINKLVATMEDNVKDTQISQVVMDECEL